MCEPLAVPDLVWSSRILAHHAVAAAAVEGSASQWGSPPYGPGPPLVMLPDCGATPATLHRHTTRHRWDPDRGVLALRDQHHPRHIRQHDRVSDRRSVMTLTA